MLTLLTRAEGWVEAVEEVEVVVEAAVEVVAEAEGEVLMALT
jgi:hypothetical protein